MPWSCLWIARVKVETGIAKYTGNGIPCLVLLDCEGEVLSESYVNGQHVGPRKVMADLRKLLKDN